MKKCSNCSLRKAYDKNPKSVLSRFWHWHIRFCPGWKCYLLSLPEEEREELIKRYGVKR